MARSVGISPDFDRIVALPVRHLSEEQAEADIELMTPLLTTPLGRAEGARLILYQGTALKEIHEQRGGYIQLGVGHGKFLVLWLGAYVTDAQRPVYICPSSLRDDARAHARKFARHWVTPQPPPSVFGFSEFYRKGAVDLFERIKPDYVAVDESHNSMNQEGTFAQRLDRWKQESGCTVVCGTGTGTRFSLKDFSHNITWALQEKAPLPLDFDTLDEWCDALDEKLKKKGNPFAQNKRRPYVGVLVNLADRCGVPAPDWEMTEQGQARWALQQRLRSTPGVIISNEDSCKQPLTIELVYAPEDEAINAAFEEFREHNEGPDGAYYNDPIVLYTKERQLGCGMVQTWDPEPPEEWREALRARNKYCAHVISHTRATYEGLRTRGIKAPHPCDSPDAVEAHPKYGQHESILEWRRIKAIVPEPKTRPTWVSASVVHAAAKYARENNALIWYEFDDVGRAIAAAAGIGIYGPGGIDSRGRHIRNDPGQQSIALSIDANLEGRNLQDRWADNYIVGAPQSARELEQLLGRTHRHGQNRPVYARILCTSGLSIEAWRSSVREATFVRETQGQDQKILRATVIEGKKPSEAVRWRVTQKKKSQSTFRKTG